jgi:hypothetical protein
MTNNTGGAWPTGSTVMVYNFNPKAAYDPDEQEKLYEYMGEFVGVSIDYDETINGAEAFPAIVIKKPDGFLDSRPVELVRIIGKQDTGAESNTGGLIRRIFDFVRNMVR